MMAIGRAATWMGASALVGIGGAGFARGVSESGAVGDANELLTGSRVPGRTIMRGQISAAFSRDDDIHGRGDYYYGQRVGGHGDGHMMPPGGEIVFGQYNLRRGY